MRSLHTQDPPARIVSTAQLPSRFGNFILHSFGTMIDGKEHVAIVKGDVTHQQSVPLRIHSECLTGDALGSLRCDCRDQLEASLTYIESQKNGVVLYLRQEGRGIGLTNKIRAYELQDRGLDTYEANTALGFKPDERTYESAIAMIKELKIRSIILMTNNPEKIAALQQGGVSIVHRQAHVVGHNEVNQFYLKTKQEKFGHLLDLNLTEATHHQIV